MTTDVTQSFLDRLSIATQPDKITKAAPTDGAARRFLSK